jgi:hypothetical protein
VTPYTILVPSSAPPPPKWISPPGREILSSPLLFANHLESELTPTSTDVPSLSVTGSGEGPPGPYPIPNLAHVDTDISPTAPEQLVEEVRRMSERLILLERDREREIQDNVRMRSARTSSGTDNVTVAGSEAPPVYAE